MPDGSNLNTGTTVTTLRPVPDGRHRQAIAARVRETAARIARDRGTPPPQANNGEADAALAVGGADSGMFVAAHATFTKGLAHDDFGRVTAGDLAALVAALNQAPVGEAQIGESPFPGVYKGPGAGLAARFDAPLYGGTFKRPSSISGKARTWESPLSGHTFDLEGTDADRIGMPPAPALGSAELTAEMAELYAAALLRDLPFDRWTADGGHIAAMLADLPFYVQAPASGAAGRRRKARGTLSSSTMLRGSTPGAMAGPYVSQFLLVGNAERSTLGADGVEQSGAALAGDAQVKAASFVPAEIGFAMTGGSGPKGQADGFIRYGIQVIPQRFAGHLAGRDHMTEWATWLDVQNGSNRKDRFDRFEEEARFIATPRDLASYVHFDALYQAYLNACLILLGSGQPFDAGLPEGGGHPTRDGFATFGGPHVLTLVTEVATRALKAVRRQKYNVHLRSRPEALAAAISLAWTGGAAAQSLGAQRPALSGMSDVLEDSGILNAVRDRNADQNLFWAAQYGTANLGPLTEGTNALLPMAFAEGSPMHPSYGAGHATVAGACVTILKAIFEMFNVSRIPGSIPIYEITDHETGYPGSFPADLFPKERALTGPGALLQHPFEADPAKGYKALRKAAGPDLSTQGELDKLAANISIGRNFGGVHFYTDYYESIRMGERVAVSILQEQMLTYREPVSMRFTSFDGDRIMIVGTGGTRGDNDAVVFVWDQNGEGGTAQSYRDWWNRHR